MDSWDDGLCIHRKKRNTGCREYPCGSDPTGHPQMERLRKAGLASVGEGAPAVPEALCAVEIAGKPHAMSVKVNGHMLPCRSATLHLDAGQLPELTVSLPVVDDTVVTLDGALGKFADETRAALVSMGWTPPPGEADGA